MKLIVNENENINADILICMMLKSQSNFCIKYLFVNVDVKDGSCIGCGDEACESDLVTRDSILCISSL